MHIFQKGIPDVLMGPLLQDVTGTVYFSDALSTIDMTSDLCINTEINGISGIYMINGHCRTNDLAK